MFERVERDGIAIHTVPSVFEACGVGIAFSERIGGVSDAPWSTLDLAGHVGDDPARVDRNRDLLCDAIGIGALRDRLTTAEQVHGTAMARIGSGEAGRGSRVAGDHPPVPATDALWTTERGIPLLMMFADCVPVVLVRPSIPAVAVVHAGWRGAAAGVVQAAASALRELPGDDDLSAYVGPHIGACCYDVGAECVSHFDSTFVTITAASTRLDLGAAVADALERSGVPKGRQWHLRICTAHNTDRFYSHRAEGLTGRHGALAVII
ncbi:MAG: laccase domain-containing protein [Coriobacteriia bacterium]|nr:laccase domain-containing protein [Coriobacteriia bacterium]MBN2841117.1 laccase domain-containing protein [Coriobacteriia bacterium]